MLQEKTTKLDQDLRRQFAEKTTRRPSCPCCRQDAPFGKRGIRWAELYGHRCEHGEPCPGFAAGVSMTCDVCRKLARESA